MDAKRIPTTIENRFCTLLSGTQVVARSQLQGLLFVLKGLKCTKHSAKELLTSLHRGRERLAHVNTQEFKQLTHQGVVYRITLKLIKEDLIREDCVEAISYGTPTPMHRASERAKYLLDVVHSDVWGPISYISLGGLKYYIVFVDDYSNWVSVFPM